MQSVSMHTGSCRAVALLAIAYASAIGCSEATGVRDTGDPRADASDDLDGGVSDRGGPDVWSHADIGPLGRGRGIPENAPWVSFYGSASELGDINRAAQTFRLINIDADPGQMLFTPEQIATLKAGGRNTVIGYFNLGACETSRSYWTTAPHGLVPCGQNTAAHLGAYHGYPNEKWMNVGNPAYQRLLLEHVAPQLASMGVDGFFLDNMEVIEHGTRTTEGPCDAACSQGGVELLGKLRDRYPNMVIVLQNATTTTTMSRQTLDGRDLRTLIDGISSEETYAPRYDRFQEWELLQWKALDLSVNGHPFSITTEDYVGSCNDVASARMVYTRSRSHGFSPYVSDSSAGMHRVCYWPF